MQQRETGYLNVCSVSFIYLYISFTATIEGHDVA